MEGRAHPGRLVVAVAILTVLSFPGQHAGTVSGAPLTSDLREAIVDDESLDPVRWKDAIGEDVYRAKRAKLRLEMWSATNAIMELLAKLKSARQDIIATTTTTTTTTAPPPTTTTTAKSYVRVPKERIARHNGDDDADVPQFNPDGTIMLQLPGKLFGNATNFVLSAAKLFGDFITNSAIRTARFVQLFQPIAGRHLFVQIPTPPSHYNER
ncbi:uncharacterized protein LOC128278903 [Anopheles cruzii]|uniref:uncharacterized protein LOC128278903 n=1 Tax=Anopheles cruzii TaxID=68878 RepID=UPI0022EC8A19|nr:uncharacterized protein LOC128278903 [Anopheles cruzii]